MITKDVYEKLKAEELAKLIGGIRPPGYRAPLLSGVRIEDPIRPANPEIFGPTYPIRPSPHATHVGAGALEGISGITPPMPLPRAPHYTSPLPVGWGR